MQRKLVCGLIFYCSYCRSATTTTTAQREDNL